jgi:hypothetical protein
VNTVPAPLAPLLATLAAAYSGALGLGQMSVEQKLRP